MTKKVIKMTKMTNLDKFKLLEIRFLHKKQVIRFLGFLDLNFKQFKFKLRFGLKASNLKEDLKSSKNWKTTSNIFKLYHFNTN